MDGLRLATVGLRTGYSSFFILGPAQGLVHGIREVFTEVDLAAVVFGPLVERWLEAVRFPLHSCLDLRQHAERIVVVVLGCELDRGGRGEDKTAREKFQLHGFLF